MATVKMILVSMVGIAMIGGCSHQESKHDAASPSPSASADAVALSGQPGSSAKSACSYITASPLYCIANETSSCTLALNGQDYSSGSQCNDGLAKNALLQQLCKLNDLLTPDDVQRIACTTTAVGPISPTPPVAPAPAPAAVTPEPVTPEPVTPQPGTPSPVAPPPSPDPSPGQPVGATVNPCDLMSGAAPLFCTVAGVLCSVTIGTTTYTSAKQCNSILASFSVWRQLCDAHLMITPDEEASLACHAGDPTPPVLNAPGAVTP